MVGRETPCTVGVFICIAKLFFSIRAVRLENHKLRSPFFRVRLGPKVLVTHRHAVDDLTYDDEFAFDLSFHQHLFWTIQVPISQTAAIFMDWPGRLV